MQRPYTLRTAGDPKKFWKSINNLLKGPKTDVIAHEFIDSAGSILRPVDY